MEVKNIYMGQMAVTDSDDSGVEIGTYILVTAPHRSKYRVVRPH